MAAILKVGIPSTLVQVISSILAIYVNSVLMVITPTAVAVYGACVKIQGLVTVGVNGMGSGLIPIVAYNYGAKKPKRIYQGCRWAMLYSVIFYSVFFLIMEMIPEQTLLLLDASEEMLAIGVTALRVMAVSYLLSNVCLTYSAAFQGLGMGVQSMLLTLSRQVVLPIIFIAVLSGFGKLSMIWMAFVLAEAVVIPFGMILWRKESGKALKHLEPGEGITFAEEKRNGSRKILFETEEKPMLRALPLIPFEICEWSYNHKVGPNSHIWFEKGQYSVPSDYLNQYVDVRYNNAIVYIYSSHKLIAEDKRLPSGLKNGKRTEASHLPYPVYIPETVESTTAKAEEIGANTTTVICRIYENAKIKEQALMDVKSVFDIASIYGEKTLEEACRRALKDFHMITYNTLIPYIKDISKSKKNKMKSENEKEQKHGIVRGADYYRKEGTR